MEAIRNALSNASQSAIAYAQSLSPIAVSPAPRSHSTTTPLNHTQANRHPLTTTTTQSNKSQANGRLIEDEDDDTSSQVEYESGLSLSSDGKRKRQWTKPMEPAMCSAHTHRLLELRYEPNTDVAFITATSTRRTAALWQSICDDMDSEFGIPTDKESIYTVQQVKNRIRNLEAKFKQLLDPTMETGASAETREALERWEYYKHFQNQDSGAAHDPQHTLVSTAVSNKARTTGRRSNENLAPNVAQVQSTEKSKKKLSLAEAIISLTQQSERNMDRLCNALESISKRHRGPSNALYDNLGHDSDAAALGDYE